MNEALLSDFLMNSWGINGTLSPLNGEYDLNFELKEEQSSSFIVKVMRIDCKVSFLEMQIKALKEIDRSAFAVPVPVVISSQDKKDFEIIADENGNKRLVWVLAKLEGTIFSQFTPKSEYLLYDLGLRSGEIDLALKNFSHEALNFEHKWSLAKPLWIKSKINCLFDKKREKILNDICEEFEAIESPLLTLPFYPIHNDLNDQNLFVSFSSDKKPFISGIIDFGDMTRGPHICNLAICCAYVILQENISFTNLLALIEGYNKVNPLPAIQLDFLWVLIKTRLAVSVVNSTLMSQKTPEDAYITISQNSAWQFLESNNINCEIFKAKVRVSCGLPPIDEAPKVLDFLWKNKSYFSNVVGKNLLGARYLSLNVGECDLPENPNKISKIEAATLGQPNQNKICPLIGRYLEPRLIYSSEDFRIGKYLNSDRRTIHLGVDIFLPEGTDIYAPMDGEVFHLAVQPKYLDYGGLLILKHYTDTGEVFFSLFGHIAKKSVKKLKIGMKVAKGSVIASIGNIKENGGWLPHLHLQLALSIDGLEDIWPGVANPNEITFWEQYCPNPSYFLNLEPSTIRFAPLIKQDLIENRRLHFAGNLTLSYDEPLVFLRGFKHYLFDQDGRPYLDAYNNVPHVGHAHPRVRLAMNKQLGLINSNTRYLHPTQKEYSEKIVSLLPKNFSIVFLVNSGSEANELAMRLARQYTGATEFITFDYGYHGNTTGAVDVSPYKFKKGDCGGQKDWVHILSCPDSFRKMQPEKEIEMTLDRISKENRKVAAFISETFPSVAGQIIPKKGVLQNIYGAVRSRGGLCIADEVQTGLGRLGDFMFAFEQQEVIPDIVVLGKPLGNGYPIGAVVTNRKIADSFANGIEFFSTFGGSNLSCTVGLEVLKIVQEENLASNAKDIGCYLIDGLRRLQKTHRLIGDVRGIGLFLGVEIIKDSKTKEPGTEMAHYICNRMQEERILIGTEGPYSNVLKIRPPLTIERKDAENILFTLDKVLSETFCTLK